MKYCLEFNDKDFYPKLYDIMYIMKYMNTENLINKLLRPAVICKIYAILCFLWQLPWAKLTYYRQCDLEENLIFIETVIYDGF